MKKSPSTVEAQIRAVEGFRVSFLPLEGAPERVSDYSPATRAREDWTVAHWREQRFMPTYPEFAAEVLWADGSPVQGKSLLSTVRLTYLQAGPPSANRH